MNVEFGIPKSTITSILNIVLGIVLVFFGATARSEYKRCQDLDVENKETWQSKSTSWIPISLISVGVLLFLVGAFGMYRKKSSGGDDDY